MNSDQHFMKLALDMAATAIGKTNPNPVVGAIIVNDGQIVGLGVHRKAGEPHAEVHAFQMASGHTRGATLYVTLEPCSHFGKTPPCAELIRSSGIARVVVAMQDPNPMVAGRGIQLLREEGIEVEVGVLESEARRLNEQFVHHMTHRRPFFISKAAMTLDGKLAASTGHSKWITGEEAQLEVHQIRNEVDAILVGINTVLTDNPHLTTRLPEGGKNPIRIILDSQLRLPDDAHVTDCSEVQTWVVTKLDADPEKVYKLEQMGVEVLSVPETRFGLDLHALSDILHRRGVTSLLVEGGSEVNGSFLRANLIDKWIIYIAPKVLGGRHSITPYGGEDLELMDEAIKVKVHSVRQCGEDICITAYPAYN
ncbi:bifunctional diaminohydroxyphosphoribosylaminopyrimidine deaminase/5-amino-6-(5-phosphoribosylamino)uracil reductase RibD [Paenibacillus sp. sptzw28]|uniref:bifunctional diaminohydroxyphosphoribosylaminopyrimidine deaminase/5-amino-6-(5-phosphoribosylamino)uracil reductase RibD n=1 Tax=Paenibacillus sp. sptzw28 TaxID=715179 RepID=UPI001C6E999A|nr:bifunctional diaminohydroxyphosphoribosylaminopyrimidine deaminase/5-amino-6-(5-phosphoribosylamino)uracil reductase RibD [Paenibacillus sp. sptzw28]QYR22513.1 bifunctional diaminohydroxyphosphoribosylaminopyrimidine deaminase/5-amino-6-(5-phosphoribosylamino)uracil reductase RibD [Paenibacillus sp. sptzw28]